MSDEYQNIDLTPAERILLEVIADREISLLYSPELSNGANRKTTEAILSLEQKGLIRRIEAEWFVTMGGRVWLDFN